MRRRTESRAEYAGQIFVIENHDEAFHIWRRSGQKGRILVHVDAHHDMWWIPDEAPITIANFICPAIKNDMVREVIWVVPDATWASSDNREALLRHLRKIVRLASGSTRAASVGRWQITTHVGGTPLRVCPLRFLPEIEEDVLLDIDVDFLMIPRVTYGKTRDLEHPLPWCWPDAVVSKLRARRIHSNLVTIAFSVEGGYTPLKWKYLGQELALRLRSDESDSVVLAGMRRLRKGATAAITGRHREAEVEYLQANRLMPASAAPSLHLAHLCACMGRIGHAQSWYQRALALEPSYRTAFNSSGLLYLRENRLKRAEAEHRRTLDLDPSDAYALLGLGLIAMRRARWQEAERLLRAAITVDDSLPEAHRALAELLDGQGRCSEATRENESAMRLVLGGHKLLSAPILTADIDGRRLDPRGAGTLEALASQFALKALLKSVRRLWNADRKAATQGATK